MWRLKIIASEVQIESLKRNMPEFHNHTDFTNGYRINYPADWQRQALSPAIMGFFAPRENPADVFSENVNVGIVDTPIPLEQYIDLQVAQMQSIPGSRLISRSEISLSGLPAHKVEFSGQVGPIMLNGHVEMLPMQWLLAFVLKNKRVFIVTYTAEPRVYNKYMPIVQEMLNSLELN
jgi:hypothetical protein